MDFTIQQYKALINALQSQKYFFQTFGEFLQNPKKYSIILRHDVDLLPHNSLRFARIQARLGIKGSYYFRAIPESWDKQVIMEVASLGHEVGYHYECLTTSKGNLNVAINDFDKNLRALRKLTSVSTICMHGSPISKYDSKDIWQKYNYRDYGIIGEPYFDLNFDKVYYLTDTGRRWDGQNVSVRDKVNSLFQQSYHATNQIIEAIRKDKLPDQVMITFHPQRWHDNYYLWSKELALQNIKNKIKKLFFINK